MNYIEYINFPSLPNELLDPIENIINSTRINSIVKQDFFQGRPVSNQLQDWLEKNLSFNFVAQYQIIYSGIPIHKDMGNRKLAYNYLLVLGGSNVKTVIFDDSKKILQSEILPLRTWHSIKTDMFHGVFGLQKDNPRVSLSVTPKQ
jgi:hypothetical protein